MSDRFVVEANRKVVGVAVRTRGGFRFFSSDPEYRPLEGQLFRRVAQMARRIAEIEKMRGGLMGTPAPRLH